MHSGVLLTLICYATIAQALSIPSVSAPWLAMFIWRARRPTGPQFRILGRTCLNKSNLTSTPSRVSFNSTGCSNNYVNEGDWLASLSLTAKLAHRSRATLLYRLEPNQMVKTKYRGTRTYLALNGTEMSRLQYLEDHVSPSRTTLQHPRPLSALDVVPNLLACLSLALVSSTLTIRGLLQFSFDIFYVVLWTSTLGFGKGVRLIAVCSWGALLHGSHFLDLILGVLYLIFPTFLLFTEVINLAVHAYLGMREKLVLEPRCIQRKARRRISLNSKTSATRHSEKADESYSPGFPFRLSTPEHYVGPADMDLGDAPHTFLDSSVDASALSVVGQIGRGAFGDLHRVKDDMTGHIMAIKRLTKANNMKDDVQAEVLAMVRLRDRDGWYTRLLGMFEDYTYFYILMPFYPRGDLLSNIQKCEGCLRRTIARFYLAELLLAIQYLHHLGVIHRDLKPENILFSNDGHVVLADFGVAHLFPSPAEQAEDLFMDEEYPIWEEKKRLGGDDFPLLTPSLDNPHVTEGLFGTPCYSSPEVREGRSYSYGVDYYSMGVLFHEMITGYVPLTILELDDGEEEDLVLDFTKKEGYFQDASPIELDFIKAVLAQEPFDRPSVRQMKEHIIFRGIDWEKLSQRELAVPMPASMVLRKRVPFSE